MPPWRHRVIVAASLHDVGDRSTIDLYIENYIPSKGRTPQNDKTPTRLSGGSSNRKDANDNNNQEECGSGGVSLLHDGMLSRRSIFD